MAARCYLKMFFTLCYFLLTVPLYAQDLQLLDKEGLQEAELVCLALYPEDANEVFLGTRKGVYRKGLREGKPWGIIGGPVLNEMQVNQIYFHPAERQPIIATDKGLYRLKRDVDEAENIFLRSDTSERDCLSVVMSGKNTLFAGTAKGLFRRGKSQRAWEKTNAPFENMIITAMVCAGDGVFLAAEDGIYRTRDDGRNWEKIFNVYGLSGDEEGSSDDLKDVARGESKLKFLAGDPNDPKTLYAATDMGVIATRDAGETWKGLPLTGLDASTIRFISVGRKSENVFAAAKSGIYRFQKDGWKHLAPVYDARYLAESGAGIIFLTPHDVWKTKTEAAGKEPRGDMDNGPYGRFKDEPSVEEVQKMAIAYAEVSPEKIRDWRRKASVKAILPKLSVGFNNNVYGTSSGLFAVGPQDWDVSFSWELGDLIYNSDQTSIDTRSKLMVELRNDILAEVTRLYFERRKLQLEMMKQSGTVSKIFLDKQLRILELTALLDRLTGGLFSKLLNSGG